MVEVVGAVLVAGAAGFDDELHPAASTMHASAATAGTRGRAVGHAAEIHPCLRMWSPPRISSRRRGGAYSASRVDPPTSQARATMRRCRYPAGRPLSGAV